VKAETIYKLPLQKLKAKCRHSAAGEECPTFIEFLTRRI